MQVMRRLVVMPLLLCAVLAAVPAAARASATQTMTFEAPRQLLDDATRDHALDEIAALGVHNIRQLVYWHDFAPAADSSARPTFDAADPAAYPEGTWARLDRLFAAAGDRHVSIQLTLTGPVPKWATKGHRDTVTEPDPTEFGAFATAVGRRYGDRVSLWSIWNEPNHPAFLMPQYVRGKPASPGIYRRLFQAGARALRAGGNQHDTILMGETAPIGNDHLVAPLAFLRGALCLDSKYRKSPRCGRLDADGYAHHPYTKRSGPRYKPPGRDNVTIGVVARLVRALDKAARAGALRHGQGVYLTEFGVQSTPDPFVGVSLTRQAEYIGIAEQIAFSDPRVKSFSQYLLTDDPPRPGPRISRYSGFETGLRSSNGTAKPAYDAFRLPLVVTDYGRSDVLWGRVRPYAHQTTVVIERANQGKPFRDYKTVTTNSAGVYGFRAPHAKGRRYRVRWTAPDGHVFNGPPIRSY
jgi:hypothetical protein